MAKQLYLRPDLPAGVKPHVVVPESAVGEEITDTTPVVLFHKGSKPERVKWDGIDHVIQPGYNTAPYAVALHAVNRLIVPGTKDLETGAFDSYCIIVTEENAHEAVPFTAAEVEEQATKPEALDRTGDPSIRVIKTQAARARSVNQATGRGRRPAIDGSVQASAAAAEAAAEAIAPPVGGEAANIAKMGDAGGDEE